MYKYTSGFNHFVKHKKFDTTTNTWVSGETTIATIVYTGTETNIYYSLDLQADSSDQLHATWNIHLADGSAGLYYAKTTGGTWGAATQITTNASTPTYSCRINTNKENRVLILNAFGTSWTGWEDLDGDGRSEVIIGR